MFSFSLLKLALLLTHEQLLPEKVWGRAERFTNPDQTLICELAVKSKSHSVQPKFSKFAVCNPCQPSPSVTILVPLWYTIVIISLGSFIYWYFQASFNLRVILYLAQNTNSGPLSKICKHSFIIVIITIMTMTMSMTMTMTMIIIIKVALH